MNVRQQACWATFHPSVRTAPVGSWALGVGSCPPPQGRLDQLPTSNSQREQCEQRDERPSTSLLGHFSPQCPHGSRWALGVGRWELSSTSRSTRSTPNLQLPKGAVRTTG